LTTPAAGILYGGHKKGSFEFSVQNNNMIGTVEMYNQPADGKYRKAGLKTIIILIVKFFYSVYHYK